MSSWGRDLEARDQSFEALYPTIHSADSPLSALRLEGMRRIEISRYGYCGVPVSR